MRYMTRLTFFLKNFWQRWLTLAQKMANFQARIFLTLFYFLIISPMAILLKLFSDPLRIKMSHSSYWMDCNAHKLDLDDFRREY